MWSVPSRRRESSTDLMRWKREEPTSLGSALIVKVALVARSSLSRRPLIALPRASSEAPLLYTSAVSNRVAPCSSPTSTRRPRFANISSSLPNAALPIVITGTLKPEPPSCLNSIGLSLPARDRRYIESMEHPHPALTAIAQATKGTSFEGNLWLVGGAVRDELLGRGNHNDFDIVTRSSSAELARLLFDKGISKIAPVTYERFGTAMVDVHGTKIEIVTARKESYEPESRKPTVEPATLEEDAKRRDFTVNALLRNLHSGELYDPLGTGLADLNAGVLRTPLDPIETFFDDPLRMLRAVRF